MIAYIPNNAYLVRVAAQGAAQLARMSWTRSVLPYAPYYTLQENLIPMAVIDLLIGVVLGLAVWRKALLVRVAMARGAAAAFDELGKRLVRAAAILLIVFVGEWGCNYRRQPLETMLAGGIAALGKARDGARAMLVEARGRTGEQALLEKADDQARGGRVLRRVGGGGEF